MEFLTNSDQLEFLQRQISVKKPSNDWSPLLYASYFGHAKIVKHLIQILDHFRTIWNDEDNFEKYDVLEDNVLGTDNGLKAFHLAIIRGHTEVMKVLLDFDKGFIRTLVHANLKGSELAVKKGHLEAAKFLKHLLRHWEENGLDIDKPFDWLDIKLLKVAANISEDEIKRYLSSSKF